MVSSNKKGAEGGEAEALNDQLADAVRALIEAIGLGPRELERRTRISKTNWSAWQTRGTNRVIHDKALEQLQQLAEEAPAELMDRVVRLRKRLQQPQDGQEAPRPRRRRWWLLAACIAAIAAIALAMTPIWSHGHRRPTALRHSTPPCHRHRRYVVQEDGNIVDAAKNRVGAVVARDVFLRDDSPGHPAMRYRYYGTVDDQAGYVLQGKLAYTGTVCLS